MRILKDYKFTIYYMTILIIIIIVHITQFNKVIL